MNINKLKKHGMTNFAFRILPFVLLMVSGCSTMMYESAYRQTEVNTIEIKTLPEAMTLVSTKDGNYFNNSNELFKNLFRYIKKEKIAMTVPVEAEIEDGRMRFFVGEKYKNKDMPDEEDVKVKPLKERVVASIGVRGSYSERNFQKAVKKIREWLKERPQYKQIAEPYAVYWNAPYVPGFLKKSEVHIPVRVED